ncbi:MAG: hypothetical protein RR214_00255 [Synergistaceae bacterium]
MSEVLLNLGKIAMLYKGTWSAAVAYKYLDIVKADGVTYLCIGTQGAPAGTAVTDTAYWVVLTQEVTDITWEQIPTANITRTTDTTIAIPGDVRVSYPKGKRLRFNGADTYLCRVYGEPVYSGGSTTITVWFDTRTTIIPTTITTMERSRLTPQDTANGTPMHGTDSAAVQATLMASYCCGCYISD